MSWLVANELGKIRQRSLPRGKVRFYLDFRPEGRVWSVPAGRGAPPVPIRDEGLARDLLHSIRSAVLQGRTLEQALAPFLARPENAIRARVGHWLEKRRAHCEAGDISPTYLRELERYARAEGYFTWWGEASIFDVTYGELEDWDDSLAAQGLAASTRPGPRSPRSRPSTPAP